ncbi:putative NTF2-like domain superfamily protein [Helianthus annuus]|nr:putative NTF2-like domain superfamily protein [Helianthus annuus]
MASFTVILNLSPTFTRLHLHQSSQKSSFSPSPSPSHSPIHHNPTCLALQSSSLESPPVRVRVSPPSDPRQDFYVNLGLAVRTLRHDLPLIFSTDLNYEIYRDDITFVDPLNKFTGIDNYKLIFRALRFHGRILFKEISLEIYRVWQPSENLILIRWNLKGVPRVPWEAKGEFQGTSRYKLDRNGKIYEHKVDNLAFNFPQQLRPAISVLDLVVASPATPNPTFSWGILDSTYSSSWLDFYRAVRNTLDPGQEFSELQDCQLVATCV